MKGNVVKEGFAIPYDTLQDAKISGNVEVNISDKELIFKEKNITRRMRGYCGKLRLSSKEIKEIYQKAF